MATALRPLFVTVTWGAGGSTATKSLELAEVCQRQLGLTTVLHLTCTNMSKKLVHETLEQCREIGIRNILALRGDPPREEYKEDGDIVSGTDGDQEQEFVWAVDLVNYIRKTYGGWFCVGVAGYPEGHADESHPEAGKQNVDSDLPYLAEKVQAGADFIMTQLTYDVEAYSSYEKRVRAWGQGEMKRIPIIPGLMPIQSYAIVKRITKLSHAKLPDVITKRIEAVKSDDEEVKKVGVDILSELVEAIKALPQPDGLPRGLHFYTLNLEKSVAFILERCRLISVSKESSPEASDSNASAENGQCHHKSETVNGNHAHQSAFGKRRKSSVNSQPHNRVILDQLRQSSNESNQQGQGHGLSREGTAFPRQHETSDRDTGVPAADPSRKHNLLISEGQGALGREATWDDFPNGRWGPSHSPAFGEIDGYGPSLKVGPVTARKLWGHPKRPEDVSDLFRRHVKGELEAVPWSDDVEGETGGGGASGGALRAETDIIRADLLRLIEERGYLTLASQPAVDGVRSDDKVFGWGPKSEGFVFQKAFVEFFCRKEDWARDLRPRLVESGEEEVSWMKTDAQGLFDASSMISQNEEGMDVSKRTPGTSGINAVTWGVFRGKEIVTPTIIESESFRAWGEEAFNVWSEWRRCFPRGSEEEQCLERIRQGVVLVNVVGQNYVGGHDGAGGGLWKVLLRDQTKQTNGQR